MIDFNQIQGISWKEWVKAPNNKRLFESNPNLARRRYMEEEAEFIENILLQERMKAEENKRLMHLAMKQQEMEARERQQSLSQLLRETATADHDSNVQSVSGFGGAAAGGGSGEVDSRTAGVAYMVVGAWRDSNKKVVYSEPDVGFERWIVGPPQ